MAIPKQPRQIMINLMYIVLTALLAMNVSAEILHAFHVVNSGIENSNKATVSKNSQVMKEFSDELQFHREDTQPFYDKAVKTQEIVADFVKKIDEYKTQIIQQSGGWTDEKKKRHSKPDDPEIGNWSPERGSLYDDQNLDATTRIMLEQKGGDEVKHQIEATRRQLLGLVDDPQTKNILEAQFPLRVEPPHKNEYGELKTWTQTNFEMMPVIASITLLNKFQNDARNSEMQILNYLYSHIYKEKIKVDAMQARVIAPSSYIFTGTPYKADILVAAYNSSENPQVLIGRLNQNATRDPSGTYQKTNVNPVDNGTPIDVIGGIGKYSMTPFNSGIQQFSGAVVIKGTQGEPTYYPFQSDYLAAEATAVVSSDNLNLIYAGISNPFSVSVPGFAAENVSATITEGSFNRILPGKYEALVPGSSVGHEVKISVTAKMPDGSVKTIVQLPYKVKSVPAPLATINGKYENGGPISKNELMVSGKIMAVLRNFYFQGVNFEVTSFNCIYVPRMNTAMFIRNPGYKFSEDLSGYISKCRSGDRFIFEDVYAKGPGGLRYQLNSIALEIK